MRIYCDDDPVDINMSLAYQDILVTVTNLPDDPPRWLPLPAVNIKEDVPKDDAINLNHYIRDIDNDVSDITYNILAVSDDRVHLAIDNQDNIDITMDANFNGKVRVDVSASDGVNSNATSFDINIEPVNDKPVVELISPAYEAILPNGTVNLVWAGSDVDTGDLSELSYTLYLDTISGTTSYRSGITGTNFVVNNLNDKTTYYWKVIPNDGMEDGICISNPLPSKFTIDIGKLPYCVLRLPSNNALIDKGFTALRWDGYAEEGYSISYDVYFSNASFEFPYPLSVRIANNITETHLLVDGLKQGETYSWTVMPRNARGTGLCTSGVWKFSYDPTVISYDLKIEVPSLLKVEHGKPTQASVKITNIGTNPDIIIPSVRSSISGSLITIEGGSSEHDLDKDQELILVLIINADKIPVGVYDLNVSITSLGSGETISRSISLKVYDEDKSSNETLVVVSGIFIAVIVILVIGILFFIRQKRKQEEARRVDAELLTPIGAKKVLDAKEVKYLPGSGEKGGDRSGPNADLAGIEGREIIGNDDQEVPRLPPTEDEMDPKKLLDKLDARLINGDISEELYTTLKHKYEKRLESDIKEDEKGDLDEKT